MTPSPLRDLIVGIFVLCGIAAIAYLSVSLGGASFGAARGITLYASFDEIGGLKPRAQVVIGGVKVGQVSEIVLDDDYRARVTFHVDSVLPIPSDSSASILTAGMLGDQYIALEPGAEEDGLGEGDEIEITQSAIVLERLIGKFMQNLGGS